MKETKKSLVETAPELKEEKSINSIPRMDFDNVDMVNETLFCAFHPDGLGEDETIDERFMALFTVFLASVGWTEAEYWAVIHEREHKCPTCGSLQDEEEEALLAEETDLNKSKN